VVWLGWVALLLQESPDPGAWVRLKRVPLRDPVQFDSDAVSGPVQRIKGRPEPPGLRGRISP